MADLKKWLDQFDKEEAKLLWEGTFADYLAMVLEGSVVSRLSHARIHEAILAAGVDRLNGDYPKYRLFEDDIYGLDKPLDRLVQYFASAAARFEVRKRILLLLGPPASGKSTIANLIKSGLEKHSETDAGAVYAIKGCPMQEEPLHLVPEKFRPQLEKQAGLYIEGDLCPRCRFVLRHEYEGKVSQMPVRRVTMNEREGIGIGSFVAAESGTQQNVSTLVGTIDESLLGGDRLQVAGRAYRLDGELNVANRGLMEFVEIFKTDERLLTVLLGLAQEQVIKMGKFGSVYADEAILAHTNEGDYRAFVADKTTEALQDRIITVRIPYNLRLSEEVRIYHKILREAGFQGVHMAPLTIPIIAIFAVLSRVEPPDKSGMSLLDKLRLYDGQFVDPYTDADLQEIQDAAPDEGMKGTSPRFVMNRLANSVSRQSSGCLQPLPALFGLWDGLGEHIALAQEERSRFLKLMLEAVKEYDSMVRIAVRKAAVDAFEEQSGNMFSTYWSASEAYVNGTQMKDPDTGVLTDPDERAMRRIEELIGVSEREKSNLRKKIVGRFDALREANNPVDYSTDHRIRAGIEKNILPEIKDLQERLVPKKGREPEAVRLRAAITQRLTGKYGYCDDCAGDAIDYFLHVVSGGKPMRQQRGGRLELLWPIGKQRPESRRILRKVQ